MLEKMGWSQGKGLGAKEDGIIEHVKVSYKNDSKGIGFKDNGEQWTENEDKFASLLESLSQAVNGDTSVKEQKTKISSLEEKSQNSKARVHYHKFTRGKDISRYSEKDLASIFGKTTKKEPEENVESCVEDSEVKTFGVDTHVVGSMVDYFKQKLPDFKRNTAVVGNNMNHNSDEDSDSERPAFGFGYIKEERSSFVSYVTENSMETKRKRKGDVSEQDNSKKRKRCEENEQGISNPAFDPLYNSVKVEKHILHTVKEEDVENDVSCESTGGANSKHKKLKKMGVQNGSINNDSFEEVVLEEKCLSDVTNYTVEINDESVEGSKKKRKKRNKAGLDNPTFNESVEEDEEKIELKKEKKLKSPAAGIDNPTFNFVVTNENIKEEQTECKKKSKKRKSSASGIDNPTFNDVATNEGTEEEAQELKTKKKKCKSGLDNPAFTVVENESPCESEVKDQKKRSKKKKRKSTEAGLDNPVFNTSADESLDASRQSNERSLEVKKGLENPGFEDHISEEISVTFKSPKKKSKKAKNNPVLLENIDISGIEYLENSVSDNYEVKRKEKKSKKAKKARENSLEDSNISEDLKSSSQKKRQPEGLDNPALNLDNSQSEIECELMLNVCTTPAKPIIKLEPTHSEDTRSSKRRKSVRFSGVNQEHLIPNRESLQETENRQDLFDINNSVIADGLVNSGFDAVATRLEENVESMQRTIENYQAEVENDINQAKLTSTEQHCHIQMVGEVGSDGENEKIEEGTKLRFKHAKFGKLPPWANKSTDTGAKKSYRHLIKGDIIVHFKNTNLHEIEGYAARGKK